MERWKLVIIEWWCRGSTLAIIDSVEHQLRTLLIWSAVLTSGAVVALSSSISGESNEAAEKLVHRAFSNLYGGDYIQMMDLITHPRGGRGMTRRLQVIRKQSSGTGTALVRFIDPPFMRRTSVLIIENDSGSDDLYVYLPAARMTRHLSSAQRGDAFFGTDLSYEDIEPKHVEDYRVRMLGSCDLEDGLNELVEAVAREGIASVYDRMVLCIEVGNGNILWADFYQKREIVKRLEIDPNSIRQIGKRYFPFLMTMRDLRRESSTEIVTERYEVVESISDTLFSTWNLEVGDFRRDRASAQERK